MPTTKTKHARNFRFSSMGTDEILAALKCYFQDRHRKLIFVITAKGFSVAAVSQHLDTQEPVLKRSLTAISMHAMADAISSWLYSLSEAERRRLNRTTPTDSFEGLWRLDGFRAEGRGTDVLHFIPEWV